MKRYKTVIRSIKDNTIKGYLEGNKRFYDMFGGETWHLGYMPDLVAFYYLHEGVREVISLNNIDISEYDLVKIDLKGNRKKVDRSNTFSNRKKRTNYTFQGAYYQGTGANREKKWQARIKDPSHKNPYRHVGYYATEEEALEAHRKAQAEIDNSRK